MSAYATPATFSPRVGPRSPDSDETSLNVSRPVLQRMFRYSETPGPVRGSPRFVGPLAARMSTQPSLL